MVERPSLISLTRSVVAVWTEAWIGARPLLNAVDEIAGLGQGRRERGRALDRAAQDCQRPGHQRLGGDVDRVVDGVLVGDERPVQGGLQRKSASGDSRSERAG